jgi:hypothetical protein
MYTPRLVIFAAVILSLGTPSTALKTNRAVKQEIQAWYAKVVDAYKLRTGLADIPTVTDVCDVEVSDGSIIKSKRAWIEWSDREFDYIESVLSGGVAVDRIVSYKDPITVVCTEWWAMVSHDDSVYLGPKGRDHNVVWNSKVATG